MTSKETYRSLSSFSLSKRWLWVTFLGASLLLPLAEAAPRFEDKICRDLWREGVVVAEPPPRLVETAYQAVEIRREPSPGVADPLIEEARQLNAVPDFKWLSDLRPRALRLQDQQMVYARAQAKADRMTSDSLKTGNSVSQAQRLGRTAQVLELINGLYESRPELLDAPEALTRPRWKLAQGSKERAETVQYIETMWGELVKQTPPSSDGSLICLPYPVIIPGARFQESYYWDSYFGIQALLRTGRWELAAMQVENFLFTIEHYGLIPNGMRDYYLTRSQPPMIYSMVREVLEAGLKTGRNSELLKRWAREKAFPLLKKDYAFWMNPATRLDPRTRLNKHSDREKVKFREERHGVDDELALAKTAQDVRAEAESGKDFTDAFEREATKVNGVLLNSILYKAELDMAWLASWLGNTSEQSRFLMAASERQQQMNRYLWDPQTRTYRDYHTSGHQVPIQTADIFATLWSGVASKEQAAGVRAQLAKLEAKGGILASEVTSGKQWDAPYVWPVHIFFAVDGLRRYGYRDDSLRIMRNWADAIDRIHANPRIGAILEKIDGVRADAPIETGDKYETQRGFLWTYAVYMWGLLDVLGYQLNPIR